MAMNELTLNAGQKLRDWFLAVKYAAFPDDRPSPLFPFFGAIVNTIPLVWGCSIIPSADCAHRYKSWASIGVFHCFLNMIFGVVIVSLLRRQIKAGIRARTSTKKLFLQNTVVLFFIGYAFWEFLWIIIALIRGTEKADDTCRRHLLAQQSFLAVYLVIGGALFVFTFATEWGQVPRWRAYAAMCYHQRSYERAQGSAQRGTTDAAAEDGDNLRERSSTSSRRGQAAVSQEERQQQSEPQPTAHASHEDGSAPHVEPTVSDDATGRDDYSEFADDERDARARGDRAADARHVRFADQPSQRLPTRPQQRQQRQRQTAQRNTMTPTTHPHSTDLDA